MKPNEKEIEAVSALPATERYKYFIKKVADWEAAWGLYCDGWAMTGNEGKVMFPLWPAKTYAEKCAIEDWGDLEAREIPLEDLRTIVIPEMQQEGTYFSIFPIPDLEMTSALVDAQQLLQDLEEECEQYE